jgi:hypothetical protein
MGCHNSPTVKITDTWSDSIVGVATRYGLGDPGIESPGRARFPAPVQADREVHPASYTMGTGSLSRG